MKFDMTIEGRKYKDCSLQLGYYENGGIALRLVGDCGEGWPEPIDNLTYNLGVLPDPSCQAVIKDNGGERGIVKRLEELGIITETIGYTESGYYTQLPVCRLDMEAIKNYT